ncbi:MAG: WD40/YVTN/BNR-like repeat-containing protein, partial [Solimonas sp.]
TDDVKKGGWHEARVDKPRGSTLTQVLPVEGALIAVGHDSWILRSEDRGETWTEVNFSTESSDPLLGIAGPYDHKLYAFGSFGLFMVSEDGGKTWKRETLTEEAGAEPAPAPPPAAEADPYADPFANFQAEKASGIGDRHLNAMTRAPDGSLWLVGERGLLAHSTNGGQSWKAQPEIYAGAFFGVLALPSRALLVYGMRGNAFYSADQGRTWKKSQIPEALSLFGGTTTIQREVVLVGASNAVFVSGDGGVSFRRVSSSEQKGIAAVLPLDSGEILTAGEGGIALRDLNPPPPAAATQGATP